ncbi:prostatic acid phosphatase isoform X2 [Halyomorpha halys]|nr:prostatic acid phosphatase-like isoform X2 [Halyomorpha halys]
MIALFTILLLIAITSSQALKFKVHEDNELVFSSIVYRHGERNPDSFYTNDPYKNLSFWPAGLGSLTDKGKFQQFKLGKWLRKRYDTLIPEGRYSHDLLYVQSTDVDRTIMSALANLAGMFYPTQQEKWSNINWQPIPVHTVPKELDKELLIMLTKCQKIKEEEDLLKNDPMIKEYNEEHTELFEYLGTHTGEQIRDTSKTRSIYTNLYIESITQDNFTIPEWARCIYPERMSRVSVFDLQMLTKSKTLKRLRGGPLLKEIITHMKQKRSGNLRQNLWMYSGHDVTLTALMDAMGVFEPHIPPLAAAVMIELRKDKNQDYFVSVYYKNSTEPYLLTIPGCTSSCQLDKFESLLLDVIPEDWDEECQNNEPDDVSFEDYW